MITVKKLQAENHTGIKSHLPTESNSDGGGIKLGGGQSTKYNQKFKKIYFQSTTEVLNKAAALRSGDCERLLEHTTT